MAGITKYFQEFGSEKSVFLIPGLVNVYPLNYFIMPYLSDTD